MRVKKRKDRKRKNDEEEREENLDRGSKKESDDFLGYQRKQLAKVDITEPSGTICKLLAYGIQFEYIHKHVKINRLSYHMHC